MLEKSAEPEVFMDSNLVRDATRDLTDKAIMGNKQITEEEYLKQLNETYTVEGERLRTRNVKNAPKIVIDSVVTKFVKQQILGTYIDWSLEVGSPSNFYTDSKYTRAMLDNNDNPLPLFNSVSMAFSDGGNRAIPQAFTQDLASLSSDIYLNNAITFMYSAITNRRVLVPDKYIKMINSLKCATTFYGGSKKSKDDNPAFLITDPTSRGNDSIPFEYLPSNAIFSRYINMIDKIDEKLGNITQHITDQEKVDEYINNQIGEMKSNFVTNSKQNLRKEKEFFAQMTLYGSLLRELRAVVDRSINGDIKNALIESLKTNKLGKHFQEIFRKTMGYSKLLTMQLDIAINTCNMFDRGFNKNIDVADTMEIFKPFLKENKIKKSDSNRIILYSIASMYTGILSQFITASDKISGSIFDIYARAASKNN